MVLDVDAGCHGVVLEERRRAGDDLDHVLDHPRLLVDANPLLGDRGGKAVLGHGAPERDELLLDHHGPVVLQARLVVPDRPQRFRNPVDVHGGFEVHGIAPLRRNPPLRRSHLV